MNATKDRTKDEHIPSNEELARFERQRNDMCNSECIPHMGKIAHQSQRLWLTIASYLALSLAVIENSIRSQVYIHARWACAISYLPHSSPLSTTNNFFNYQPVRMLFKALVLVTALLGVAVFAAPSNEKRQFGTPPSNCKDMQAFENCVSSNPESCFNPLPEGQAAW